MRRPSVVVLVLVLALAAVGYGACAGKTVSSTSPRAPNTWTELSPKGTSPTGRNGQSMVYDPATRRVLMFGGMYGDYKMLNDTWTYDQAANTWTDVKPQGALPTPRNTQAMVYDPDTNRVIMYAGETALEEPANDTWAYDPAANTWSNLKPSFGPSSARIGASMAYDPSGHRVIMYGGANPSVMPDDIWAYDAAANSWKELKPGGAVPPGRIFQSMVYEPIDKRMIVFGGVGPNGMLNDTWAYDPAANTWTDLKPSGTPPSPRWGFSMVYSASTGRIILFGGCFKEGVNAAAIEEHPPTYNDVWAYDVAHNAWSALTPAGSLPPTRGFCSMAYDSDNGHMIIFGGSNSSGDLKDTWEYTP